MDSELERRELLRQTARLLAGALLVSCREPALENRPDASGQKQQPQPHEHPPPQAPSPAPARALLPPQRATLEAACARILPTDHEPGAREAGVIEYIDRELTRPEYSAVKKVVIGGVVALDRVAMRLGAKPFVDLLPVEQDDVLHQVQRQSDRGRDFVKFLVAFTLEGFAGDPIYGGNKNGVGWKFVGYGPGNPDGSGKGGHGGH